MGKHIGTKDIAEYVGISIHTYRRVESGKKILMVTQLVKIAEFLNVPITAIVEEMQPKLTYFQIEEIVKKNKVYYGGELSPVLLNYTSDLIKAACLR